MFILDDPPVSSAHQEILRRLFTPSGPLKYALGRNAYSASVVRVVDLAGIIDDYTSEASFQGKPVVRMESVPAGAIVVSCVVEAKPLTALAKLQAAGLRSVIDYFTLARLFPNLVEPVPYLGNAREDIRSHLGYYQWLESRLEDEVSRQSLRKVTNFRSTRDLTHLHGFSFAVQRQYFEDFIPYSGAEVFVDGGAFDGETALQFRNHCPNYKGMYIFEPTPAALETARQKLAMLQGVQFIQRGLFDCRKHLRFDASAGTASRISETGQNEIEVTTLDEEVREPVTFIKLDVEGAECGALRGAQGHIRQDHPKLAVCVYHQQSDFWQVPLTILNFRNDYKIYLRHYTEGILETVMFFIPTSPNNAQRRAAPLAPPN